jgi:predicted RNA-binding Zn ribbon-like protein
MQADSSAPGALDLVRLFINTRDQEAATDAIATPTGLVGWLAQHGLLDAAGEATDSDVRHARELREALRGYARANNGHGRDPRDADQLAHQARRVRLAVTFTVEGAVITPRADGVDGALGTLLAITSRAMSDGSFARLKACHADDCGWVYYDHSRNNTRAWCSMQVCGNRHKIRAYRERHRQQPPVGD